MFRCQSFFYILIIAIAVIGCDKKEDSNQKQSASDPQQVQKINTEQKQIPEAKPADGNKPAQIIKNQMPADTNSTTIKKQAQEAAKPKIKLADVIKSAKTWGAINPSWHGKPAPDFTLLDIKGQTHKLSDYKGKNVMLVFWATWCGPCKMEVPHLIELRNIKSPNEMVILAISNENAEKVKQFVETKKINYTVLLDNNKMPAPYGVDRLFSMIGIPASFFIDPQGNIKLATSGALSIEDMKAILEAE